MPAAFDIGDHDMISLIVAMRSLYWGIFNLFQFQLQGSIPGSDEDLSNLVPMQKLAGNDSIEDEFFLNVDLDNPQSHHQGSIPGSDEDLMDVVPMQVEDEFLSADDEEFHSAEENDPITKHWNKVAIAKFVNNFKKWSLDSLIIWTKIMHSSIWTKKIMTKNY